MFVSLFPQTYFVSCNMARAIRKKSGTGIYHVMLRGINRQDSDVKAFLLDSQEIANPLMVQSLEKTRRNEVLRAVLALGAGIRQASRLTGVSFGVIQKLAK